MEALIEKIWPSTKRNHVYFCDQPSDLIKAEDKKFNLAICERTPSPALDRAIQSLMDSSFRSLEMLVNIKGDYNAFIEYQLAQEINLPVVDWQPLGDDIISLASIFHGICKTDYVKLYLKKVKDDSCRKFHIDGYEYRLFCSYAGPGTEWVYNHNVSRKYIGHGSNEQIIKDMSKIQQLHTYDVAILKGELPHQLSGKGIVHRSPPIEYQNQTRLILRIDSQ
ncbi:MAG: DUF1826 domain-containing protein [Flammeovirgaceae bacterium]